MSLQESILKNADALYTFLNNVIPQRPKGCAEYTTLPQSNFSESEYQRLMVLLDELQKQGVIGYRKWDRSVSVIIHKRKATDVPRDNPLRHI